MNGQGALTKKIPSDTIITGQDISVKLPIKSNSESLVEEVISEPNTTGKTIEAFSSVSNISEYLAEEASEIAKGRRVEYYRNGQNGMELIVKKGDSTVVVSTFDARPVLKEAVALLIYQMYDRKQFLKDSPLTVETPNAIVKGLCKVTVANKFTNLGFYFQKIYWNSGLTEFHQGEEFVAKPSSAPFVQPKTNKKKIVKKKKH